MRKFLKHFPFNKLFVSLFVILYTFVPSAQAIGVVIEETSTKVDTSEDILDEGISDPAEIANPNVLGEEVVPEVEEPLFTYVDGVYTVNEVVVDEEYVYPDNSNVRIKFTSITEEGNLVISKVLLTEEEKELLNTSDDYGWDISSSMSNGSFIYDLTLPNNTESNDVEVKYSEDGEVYNSIDNVIVNEDVIEIKGLEHFTIFVVVDDDSATYTEAWIDYATQGYYEDGVHYPAIVAAGQTATWTFPTITPGSYNVYVSWSTHANRTTSAPYTLNHTSGADSFTVNQEQLADQSTTGSSGQWSGWRELGTFDLDTSSYLVLTSVNNGSGTDYVIADEVLLVSNESPVTVWVDDDYTINSKNDGHVWGYDAFTNIQNGIKAVASGGTVYVAAGTYIEEEQIVIDKDLSIIGADKTNTIIKPAQDTGSSDDLRGWFLVNSGINFTLKNTTLDGAGYKIFQAIRSHGPTTIENNIIKNMLYDPSTSYEGRGIVVYDGYNSNILGNTLENIGRIGIFVFGTGTQALVEYNTYIGKGSGDWLDYGIEIGGGGQATIKNNTISNNKGVADSDGSTSAGILVTTYWGIGTTVGITNNSIHDNSYGVALGYSDDDTASVFEFYENIFNNNTYDLDNHTVNKVDARNNTWSVTDLNNLDQIEAKINHYCSGSTYVHGVCNEANDYGTGFGMVQYKDIGVPTNSGWNIKSKSETANETPLDVACGGYSKENSVAQNWTAVSGENIKYQREVTYPNGSIGYFNAGGNNYTPFATFGGNPGIEGLWKTRVRAFVDPNNNNIPDPGEETSGWSNECNITFDKTAPSVPTNGAPNDTFIPTNNFDFTWNASSDASPVTYEFQSTLNPAQSGGVLTTGLWKSETLPGNMIHSSGAPDGKWYWQVRATDLAGNTSTWSSIWNVTLDQILPTVDLVFPAPGPSSTSFQAIFSEDVVESEAENPANYFLNNWPGAGGSGDLTGDATIVYNSSTRTATVTFTNLGWYISPEQQWGVQNIHDLAGNIMNPNPYSETSTPMLPPVTTDSGTDSNWHNTPVTVNLSCTDISGSGCKKTYYTTDGSTPTISSSSGNSITLSTDGIYTIKYFSVDNAGNEEIVKTALNTVKIDRTNLKILSIEFDKEAYKVGDTMEISVNIKNNGPVATEDAMDQLYLTLGLDMGTWQNHMYRTEVDLPNIEAGSIGTITIEKVVPAPGSDSSNLAYWTDGTYTVSSVLRMKNGYKDYYTNNGNYKFVIDNTAPDSPAGLYFMNKATEEIISCGSYSNIKNNLTEHWAENIEPDLDHYEYSSFNAPNGSEGLVNKPFGTNSFDSSWWTIPMEGIYSFKVRAVDLAGNPSGYSEMCSINIDWTDPEIADHDDMTLIEGQPFPTDTVTLTDSYGELDQVCAKAKDLTGTLGDSDYQCVPIDSSNYTADQFSAADEVRKAIEEWQGSPFNTIDLSVLPEGTYEISYYATDKAGNASTTQTFTVTIQNNAPTITIDQADIEVTAGSSAITLTTTVTSGNSPFTYLWTEDCTGTDAQTTFDPTTAGEYTCTVTVTDADGDTSTDSVDITVGAVEENENTGEVLGVTTGDGSTGGLSDGTAPSSKQPPTKTYIPASGTGGYLYSQTDLLDTDEQQTPEEETTTQDNTAVKGEEDNNEQPTNQEQTPEEETTKWWIYPLVILPLLAIFLILWKRRKEDNQPQF
jgi:hypothetical protein